MKDLREFSLHIPQIWDNEWGKVISESTDPERIILINQARLANMLKSIEDFEAFPERIAWLALWTRVFSAIEGALGALPRNSLLSLNIICRCVFEVSLHVEVILEPAAKLFNKRSSNGKISIIKSSQDYALDQSIDRLRAYATWCLFNDKKFYKDLSDYRTQNAIWDPDPAADILTNPDKKEMYEKLFRPIDLETDKNILNKNRKDMEKYIRTKMKLIANWLQDPLLDKWYKKIEELDKQHKGNVPFFSLFDVTTPSIAKRLNKIGLRFGYSTYMQGSMLIHGSTIDQVLNIGENSISPMFIGTEGECKTAALSIADNCNEILVRLEVLRRSLWNDN